jgi:hypothetical protein
VNYRVTGTIQGLDALCNPSPHPGYADICPVFVTGTPFVLTYTVNLSTQAGFQTVSQNCLGPNGQFATRETQAVYSKAVSNINLQLANGVSYIGKDADVSLINDLCLSGGISAWDFYRIDAKSVTGPNSFPSFSGGTATVSFFVALTNQAGVGLGPLPPPALTTTDLSTAAPEAHLLQYTTVQLGLAFRFPTVGQPSWGVGLIPASFEVVP